MRKNNDFGTILANSSRAFIPRDRLFIPFIIVFIVFLTTIFITFFLGQPSISVQAQNQIVQDYQGDIEMEEELKESIGELIGGLDTESLQEYINSLQDFQSWRVKDKILELINGGTLDYPDIFTALFSVLTDSLTQTLPTFALICAIAILCGILNTIKTGFLQDSTTEIIFFVCYAAILVLLLTQLIGVFSLCFETIKGMKTQMEIVFPLLLTLMAGSGGSVSATVYSPAVVFLCDGIVNILQNVVMPFTVVIIILNMLSNLSQNIKLEGFVSLFKSANKWLIGISVAVFGIFLSVQGLTSATYDGISLRAAKYALSNSIPIVGGFISGGFDIVLAGSTLIKNSVGVMGIFILISTVLQPALTLVGFSLGLKLTAAVCEPIGDERISKFLGKLSESMGYLIACLCSLAFLYFLTVILLICSAGVIV